MPWPEARWNGVVVRVYNDQDRRVQLRNRNNSNNNLIFIFLFFFNNNISYIALCGFGAMQKTEQQQQYKQTAERTRSNWSTARN